MAKSKLAALFVKVKAVADPYPVAPILMARFATEFSELPRPGAAIPRLLRELVHHPNASMRRIGISACRRIARFDAPGLREALLGRLSDTDPWVRYDAAWGIGDAGYDGPDVRAALATLAGNTRLPRDYERSRANPSDAELAGRVRARQALDALLATGVGRGG